MCWLTTICSSSVRGANAFFSPPLALRMHMVHSHMCRQNISTHKRINPKKKKQTIKKNKAKQHQNYQASKQINRPVFRSPEGIEIYCTLPSHAHSFCCSQHPTAVWVSLVTKSNYVYISSLPEPVVHFLAHA